MSKLRICMLTTFYPPYSFGGDAIGVQRLSKALAGRGHHVTVIHDQDAYFSLSKAAPPAPAQSDGVDVIGMRSSLGLLSNLLTHQFGTPVVHGRSIREILARGRFDVVWYHNVSLIGGPGILSLGEGLKVYEAHEHWLVCPTHVLWRHNRELCDARQCLRCVLRYRRPPQLWRYTNVLNAQLDNVHLLIAKSEFSRSKHRQFGLRQDMEVVPYFLPDRAADDEETAPPHDRPYFLFVGRLEKIKGLQDVIPEFARYGDADLLIIGSGEYEPELRRLSGGIPAVKFVGRLPPEQLARYYRHAIALIVPSICFETFGIILIESFQRGTPVIARNIGPFVEIVERSGGGMLFSSMVEMVDAMRTLQVDTHFRESLAHAAREAFRMHWCEEVVMNQYLAKLHAAAMGTENERIQKILESELAQ